MIIEKFPFNIYALCILLSLSACILYNIYFLKKKNINNEWILLIIIIVLPFVLVGGKILTILTSSNDVNFITVGFSSYGGAIGLLLAVFLFEKITNNKEIKTGFIISLPLMYSVSKLGCFFAGCCHGIKYNGIFSITYPHLYDYSVFPIQLLESIVFFFIFLMSHILYKKYHSKNIIEYVCIVCAIAKFLLDYLRYSHIDQILSINQGISIAFVIIMLISIFYKKKKVTNI